MTPPATGPRGTVRIDDHELLPSPAGPLALHRGGYRYAGPARVKYGELALSDLARPLAAPQPAGAGRGAACALAGAPPYEVSARSIPRAMHYKQSGRSGSNRGSSFLHYGDPGADQGRRHDIHYTYLLWSFVDVHGGGMVRTLLAPRQIVRPCDVAPITMSSWDSSGAVNGAVTARYVRTLAGTCPLYGWMIWSHTYARDGAGPVAHAMRAAAAPPPDPAADPACPVAPPAAPASP